MEHLLNNPTELLWLIIISVLLAVVPMGWQLWKDAQEDKAIANGWRYTQPEPAPAPAPAPVMAKTMLNELLQAAPAAPAAPEPVQKRVKALAPVPAAPEPVHNGPPIYGAIGNSLTDNMKIGNRRHTAIVGITGDGKTATMNAMLVADIASGAQCVVCSTHFTYFNEEDQPIDLRPLKDHFQAEYTKEGIAAAIKAARELIDVRMPRYRNNQAVGHPVVLYLGEYDTSITRLLGDYAGESVQHILDEGRKTNVWIGFIEMHGAQVKRFGGDGAVRSAFGTKMASANVDSLSWKVFVGEGIPKERMPLGDWMTDRGIVRVTLPTIKLIEKIAERPPHGYAPLRSSVKQPVAFDPAELLDVL